MARPVAKSALPAELRDRIAKITAHQSPSMPAPLTPSIGSGQQSAPSSPPVTRKLEVPPPRRPSANDATNSLQRPVRKPVLPPAVERAIQQKMGVSPRPTMPNNISENNRSPGAAKLSFEQSLSPSVPRRNESMDKPLSPFMQVATAVPAPPKKKLDDDTLPRSLSRKQSRPELDLDAMMRSLEETAQQESEERTDFELSGMSRSRFGSDTAPAPPPLTQHKVTRKLDEVEESLKWMIEEQSPSPRASGDSEVTEKLREENQSLLKRLADAEERLKLAEHSAIKMEDRLESVQREHQDEMGKLLKAMEDERTAQLDRIKELDTKLRKSNDKQSDLESRLEGSTHELFEKEQAQMEIEERNKMLQSEIAKLQKVAEESKASLETIETLQAGIEKMKNENEELKTKLAAAELGFQEATKNLDTLCGVLEEVQSENTRFQDRLQARSTSPERQIEERTMLEDKIKAMEKQLAEQKGEDFTELERENAHLRQELERLESSGFLQGDNDNDLVTRMEQLQDVFGAREQQLVSDLDAALTREESTQRELNNLYKEYARVTASCADYDEDRGRMKGLIDSQREKLAKMQEQVDELVAKKIGAGESASFESMRAEFRRTLDDLRSEHQAALNAEWQEREKAEGKLRALKRDLAVKQYELSNEATQTVESLLSENLFFEDE